MNVGARICVVQVWQISPLVLLVEGVRQGQGVVDQLLVGLARWSQQVKVILLQNDDMHSSVLLRCSTVFLRTRGIIPVSIVFQLDEGSTYCTSILPVVLGIIR